MPYRHMMPTCSTEAGTVARSDESSKYQRCRDIIKPHLSQFNIIEVQRWEPRISMFAARRIMLPLSRLPV